MRKVEYSTWFKSDFKAGVNLANILTEIGNEKITNKVSYKIDLFRKRFKSLENIEHKEYLLKLVLHDAQNNIKDAEFPLPLETHLLNVITFFYRNSLNKSCIIK